MASTTRHSMENRQAGVGHPPEGSRKTHTPILEEEETTPLHNRLYASCPAPFRPEHSARCLSFCMSHNVFFRNRPRRGVYSPKTRRLQSQHTCLPCPGQLRPESRGTQSDRLAHTTHQGIPTRRGRMLGQTRRAHRPRHSTSSPPRGQRPPARGSPLCIPPKKRA